MATSRLDAPAGQAGQAGTGQVAGQRERFRGWSLLASRAAALAYLLYVIGAIRQDAEARPRSGLLSLAAFAVGWLVIRALHAGFSQPALARFWTL